MPSLYSVIKKSAPYCKQHTIKQALYYNVEQLEFLCEQCVSKQQNVNNCQLGQKSTQQTCNSNNKNKKTFTLEEIVENPVLLMLKQGSFLSKIDPSTTTYKVQQFMRILTDMDTFIKSKKSTHQFTQQFFTHLKQQINNKINFILKKVQQNIELIQQLQKRTRQLKNLKKNYSNQFLQTLQTNFVNGTEQQLRELLKKYSIENQNPFRKIDEIVGEISNKVDKFVEINWQHVMGMERRLLDGYMWRSDKVFLIDKQHQKLVSLKQENIILPYSAPYRLQFVKQINQQQMYCSEKYKCQDQTQTGQTGNYIKQQQHSQKDNIYIKCTNNSIQLLIKKPLQQKLEQNTQKQQQQHIDQYVEIDKYQCKLNNNIDTIYQLPYKQFLSVSYQNITFYTYLFNKIKPIQQINTIKGCSQVLVFGQYCLILAINHLYMINYHQLQKVVNVKVDKMEQDCEVVEGMMYLYKERKKIEDQVLINIFNKDTQQSRSVRLTVG